MARQPFTGIGSGAENKLIVHEVKPDLQESVFADLLRDTVARKTGFPRFARRTFFFC